MILLPDTKKKPGEDLAEIGDSDLDEADEEGIAADPADQDRASGNGELVADAGADRPEVEDAVLDPTEA